MDDGGIFGQGERVEGDLGAPAAIQAAAVDDHARADSWRNHSTAMISSSSGARPSGLLSFPTGAQHLRQALQCRRSPKAYRSYTLGGSDGLRLVFGLLGRTWDELAAAFGDDERKNGVGCDRHGPLLGGST